MPKFFVTSDTHSYYTAFKKALDEAGFDQNNKDHWLIICGDVFDRGPESVEILHFIMSLERKILVKGNHDILLEDCCMREYAYMHDASNGTKRTIQDIGRGEDFAECCCITWGKLARYRELLVNYFETQNYIFVHSWIPVSKNDYKLLYNPDWRNSNQDEWDDAMWGNPFAFAEYGFNKTGKTIVFGHWHSSTGWAKAEGLSEFGQDAKFEPYYGEGYISIDRCTAYTGEVNVIVIKDEFLEE